PVTTPTDFVPPTLHDALPISGRAATLGPRNPPWGDATRREDLRPCRCRKPRTSPDDPGCSANLSVGSASWEEGHEDPRARRPEQDRKSTRLNSSHVSISYAVF